MQIGDRFEFETEDLDILVFECIDLEIIDGGAMFSLSKEVKYGT